MIVRLPQPCFRQHSAFCTRIQKGLPHKFCVQLCANQILITKRVSAQVLLTIFFPRASERKGSSNSGGLSTFFTSSHLHITSLIFTFSLILSSSHPHIFTSSHLLIFTFSGLHIFSSSHFHIFTFSNLHIFPFSHHHIPTSSHLPICSFSHLLIFTSSHLHIFSSSHLDPAHPHIFTFSNLHIFASSHPHIFTSAHLQIFSS